MNRIAFWPVAALLVFTACTTAASTPEPAPSTTTTAPTTTTSTTTTTTAPPPTTTTTRAPRATTTTTRVRARQPAATARSAPSATLERIARCESGGDPTAVSASGKYRGKYQADRSTWANYRGYASADQAPEAVQDQWATELHRRRGTQPWPSCGR